MIRAVFAGLFGIVVLAGAVYWFASRGPWSFRAAFDRDAAARLGALAPTERVTETDVAPLPDPVRRYLRRTGVVGEERVRSMRVRFRGFLRGGPAEPWMPIVADQYSFFEGEPTRLFHIQASRVGVPFEAFHRFVGPNATFTVKLASLVKIVDARGPEMDRSETVTFFNDMVLLAPATLLSPAIRWEAVDDRTVRATYTQGAQAVRAELRFDADGDLVESTSDDRSMASKDGRSFREARWTTPVSDYTVYGSHRLAGRGSAVWTLPEGAFEYARFELVEVEYNPQAGRRHGW